MKRYRWTCLEPEPTLVQALSEAINVSSPIAAALVNRGISSFEEARRFSSFARRNTVTIPFNDMKRAVGRLSKAIFGGEKIMVYGDYDVDGTSGTAMLSLFLREMGAEVCHYINDRFTEGYGLSEAGIAWAFEQGCRSSSRWIAASAPSMRCRHALAKGRCHRLRSPRSRGASGGVRDSQSESGGLRLSFPGALRLRRGVQAHAGDG